MKKTRIAVIGAGLIGRRHIELISENKGSQLAAICDRTSNCKTLADELNVPFYQDYEPMLDAEMPDGVIIATSTEQHAAIGLACIERSISGLIEKPITVTLAEGHQLLEAAEKQRVPILVGHYRRFNPLIQQARSVIQNGDLGRLVGVTAMFSLLKPDDYYNMTWRTQPGGGPVLINLIHEIDCLRYICGEIRSIYATTSSATRGFAVEDTASITLEFENGALGSLLGTDAVPAPWSYEATTFENPMYFHTDQNCFYFMGSKGSLAFPRMELWRYPNEHEAGWRHPLVRAQLSIDPLDDVDPLTAQLDHFCQVIRGEELPVVSGADGLQTLAATLAIHESARQKSPVYLDSPSAKQSVVSQ